MYDISYKIFKISSKTLHIIFDNIEGIVRICDGTRYLTLFGSTRYYAIYNRIKYLISLKSNITCIFSHNFAKIKVGSYNYFPVEKTLTWHNVIIHIKSFLIKDKNHYCNKIFLETFSNQLAKKLSEIFLSNIIMVRIGEKGIEKNVLCCEKTCKNLG